MAISLEEAKQLEYGNHVRWYSSNKNKIVNLKINGKPKTWKTRPHQVRIPVKYGLYEYFYLTENDLEEINPKE